jgi:hypothetical protein
MRAAANGFDESIHRLGIITAIAIEKDYDLATRRDRAEAGAKRPTVAALGFKNDTGARGFGNLGGAIVTAIIDDNYFVGDVAWDLTNDFTNGSFFVKRGDDD